VSIFVGNAVKRWAGRTEFGISWIQSPPLSGTPTYPVFIDLVETVQRAIPKDWPLLKKALLALAPAWEELEAVGLEPARPRQPTASDLGSTDEAPIVQRFLACTVAQVLAKGPENIGLIIRSCRHWDITSLEFLDRLVREPQRRISIAIEFSGSFENSPIVASIATHAQVVNDVTSATRGGAKAGDFLLALCPHGLPVSVLQKLDRCETQWAESFEWPGGGQGLVLPASRARALAQTMAPQNRRDWHRAIFDAYPYDGWNYIRRSGHAIASGNPQRLLAQHTACLAGLSHVGYEYLYRQLAAEVKVLEGEGRTAAHIGAARLAPRISGRGGRRKAMFHYRQALNSLPGSPLELPIMHELANLYANGKTPYALAQSRKLYGIAFAVLNTMPRDAARDDAEIRLRNGLALVDYKQGRDVAALAHEQRALKLVEKRRKDDPRTQRWTASLILINTAKLLIKRFDDPHGAIKLIEGLLDSSEERIRQSSQQTLGRIHFDRRNYHKVVEYLAPYLERDGQHDLSESEELFDRFIFVLSLLALDQGKRAARQLSRMQYLAHVNSAADAETVIEQLALACGDRG
jgi:hypothetical protein